MVFVTDPIERAGRVVTFGRCEVAALARLEKLHWVVGTDKEKLDVLFLLSFSQRRRALQAVYS